MMYVSCFLRVGWGNDFYGLYFRETLVVQVIQHEGREFADKLARKGLYVKSDPEAVVELFDIYQANEWMAIETEHETLQMLFGNFWLEGELCILFADTNMGKSLLAVLLADSITRGEPIAPFTLGGRSLGGVVY